MFTVKSMSRRSALVLLAGLGVLPIWAQSGRRVDLSKLVVVGDSLSAGVQNISLVDYQQTHGYAALIAQQAGINMVQPLIKEPGDPRPLCDVTSSDLGACVGAILASAPMPITDPLPRSERANPDDQPTNISVPGYALADARTRRAAPLDPATEYDPLNNVQRWANLVLDHPGMTNKQGQPATQVEQAIALEPSALIVWIGSNDLLVPALLGLDGLVPGAPTPTDPIAFGVEYDKLLNALEAANAPIVVATIPDVTKVPYFTPVEKLAEELSVPFQTIQERLGVSHGDYVRPGARILAKAILAGVRPGPLTGQFCPSTIKALPAPGVGCVMKASDVRKYQILAFVYNAAIRLVALKHNALVVDIYALVNHIAWNGYNLSGRKLTTDFLGGLFSLDGMHPNDTGYAIIANEFIKQLNAYWGTRLTPVSVSEVFAQDPLAAYIGRRFQ